MRSTMLDMDSRLRAATAVEQNETLASQSVFEILRRRGHPDAPPPTITDGWGGIDDAMVNVYWKDGYYNLIKLHKSLRLPIQDIPGHKWQQRTPMMAAGLTDHAWTVKELFTTIPLSC